MKYIFLIFILVFEVFGNTLKFPITSINKDENLATIKVSKIDIGVSGFIVHKISKNHSSIVKNAVVKSFDKETQTAVLSLSDYDALKQNSLPKGKWHVEVGDMAVLAFGYSRGILIAPSEEVYYKITRTPTSLQWVHPDIFATILSFRGHPTPLKEDFKVLGSTASLGLVFFFLNEKLYTVDIKSFAILNISDAPIKQTKTKLPFYTRVKEIDASWWGEGSDELKSYESYYFGLLKKYNQNNTKLQEEITKFNKKGKK